MKDLFEKTKKKAWRIEWTEEEQLGEMFGEYYILYPKSCLLTFYLSLNRMRVKFK